ncbi:MAG: nucleotidyltransferase family protein [Bacteroidales bacterium]|nr:nucleotidyltransferase family protein [Bacteroidales bacterium]
MMNRRQTYYFIGNLLSFSVSDEQKKMFIKAFKSPAFNWPVFVALGSNHLVLQTIYCKLFDYKLTDYLPSEIKSHLKRIYDLNFERNTEIISQVDSVNLLLNKHGIAPLYMKGAGNIIDGLYTDIGERIMHDIDILIQEEQWNPVISALLQDGYCAFSESIPGKTTKHYPPLYKSGNKITLEIHRAPVDNEHTRLISTKEIWDNRKQINGHGDCYVMSNHHKIILNFIHSQLTHHGYSYARAYLRDLYDLQLLSSRENIEENFKRLKRYRSRAISYVGLMNKVFQGRSTEKLKLNILNHIHLFRCELNLKLRIAGMITFLLSVMFRSYILIPFRSLKNQESRNSLPKKLFDKNWYMKHYRSLTRIYRINTS